MFGHSQIAVFTVFLIASPAFYLHVSADELAKSGIDLTLLSFFSGITTCIFLLLVVLSVAVALVSINKTLIDDDTFQIAHDKDI